MKKTTLFGFTASIFAAAFINLPSLAQTGAAGVGSSSTNKVWLDAHALALTNGTQVATFTDYSGNSNNFTQTVSTRRPIYTTNAIGTMPALDFDGSNDWMSRGVTSGLETSNLTYFIVFQRSAMANQMIITAKYSSSANKWRLYSNSGSNTLVSAQYSPSIQWVGYTDPAAGTFVSTHITPSTLSLYKQGTLQQTKTATYTAPTGHQQLFIGGTGTGSYSLNGYVAEVIVYNTALNSLERILVENYLGAKYGLSIPTDMYIFQNVHKVGLIGIGNDGTNSQTTARGAGVVEFSGASSLGSGDYLLAAHTDVLITDFTTTDLPVSLPGYERLTRTWRVDETHDIGTVDVKFYLTGTLDFAASTSYTLLIDTDGNFTNATQVVGTYDGGTQTVTFDNVDFADGNYFTLAGDPEILDIHSITTGDWSDPNTWDCTCTPGFQDQVTIEPTHTVTVDVDGSAGNLTVASTGTLAMTSAVTLNIYQDWDIAGSLNLTDGEIALVGSSNQSVDLNSGSGTLHDITINKTGTATFTTGTFTLNGTLSPSNGTLTVDASADFIINSTSSGVEGRVGEISPTCTVSGDFTVRRFIPAGNGDFRDLCSPVVGATFDDWDPDLQMSGPGFPDGCAYGPDGCYESISWMNNSVTNYVYNSTDVIVNGRGYSVWVADDETSFGGATLNVKGTLRDYNDVTLNFATGWATLGNPYASPVLFSGCTRTTPIGNYFYIYDTDIADYQWYDGTTDTESITELMDGAMNTGQGVWIEVGGSGSITFHESAKTSTATYIRTPTTDQAVYLNLAQQGTTYRSRISIVEYDEANDGCDPLLDMRHLRTGNEAGAGLAFALEDDNLIKRNFIKPDFNNKSFELSTEIITDGYYTFSLSNFEYFEHYRHILLYDNNTHDFVDLKTEEYTFYADSSAAEKRFTLVFTNAEWTQESTIQALTNKEQICEKLSLTQMGHVFNLNVDDTWEGDGLVSVVNVLGQTTVFNNLVAINAGNNLITLPADLHGVFILSIASGDKVITKKIVL